MLSEKKDGARGVVKANLASTKGVLVKCVYKLQVGKK